MIFSSILRCYILHLMFRQVSFDNYSKEEISEQLLEVSFIFFGPCSIHCLVPELDVVYDHTKSTGTFVEFIAIPLIHICKLRLLYV